MRELFWLGIFNRNKAANYCCFILTDVHKIYSGDNKLPWIPPSPRPYLDSPSSPRNLVKSKSYDGTPTKLGSETTKFSSNQLRKPASTNQMSKSTDPQPMRSVARMTPRRGNTPLKTSKTPPRSLSSTSKNKPASKTLPRIGKSNSAGKN